MVKIVHISIF